MPKIYEYLGIVIQFFSNEHDPVHIHASTDKGAMKVSFFIKDGKIIKTKFEHIGGKFDKEKDLRIFVKEYKDRLVNAWVDYFVYHKSITCIKITKKL
ncbi:MAG: DUF4160 domain-containing protein [Bacteroidales bacterium]|nr:DUF4160 domain-containing protein [Bacteroidales bacterium]MBR6279417.1 DUF4160 domain-containing protein [Bacteroidales bacterium]